MGRQGHRCLAAAGHVTHSFPLSSRSLTRIIESYEIPRNLRKLRIKCQLSQQDFGALLGVSRSRVAFWESGERPPTLDTFRRICIVFKVSASELLGLGDMCPLDELKLDKRKLRLEARHGKAVESARTLKVYNFQLYGRADIPENIRRKLRAMWICSKN